MLHPLSFLYVLVLFSCLLLHALSVPHGVINSTLHEQALSHFAFHSNPVKLALASLFPHLKTVAVVGVEWGEEVIFFAEKGYHVYAFEPATKFVSHLQKLMHANPSWNITLVPVAASNSSQGTMELCYGNEGVKETVKLGRVDDHVHEPLAVFSLDIQGDELHILEGSTSLLSAGLVASLWVEAIACNPKVSSILRMLNDDYIFFDFVPWGRPSSQKTEDIPRTFSSFAFNPDRASEFDSYLEWICSERQSHYEWLQTDLLIIRRDLLSHDVYSSLSTLSDTYCSQEGVQCLYRSLLLDIEHRENTGKEEL